MKFTLDVTLPERILANRGDDVADAFTGALLAIDGVASVFGVNDFVTITRERGAEWEPIVCRGRGRRRDPSSLVPRRTVFGSGRAGACAAARRGEGPGDHRGRDPTRSGSKARRLTRPTKASQLLGGSEGGRATSSSRKNCTLASIGRPG